MSNSKTVVNVYSVENSTANAANVVINDNVRVTVLSPCLVRFEKSDNGFTDAPTQGVICRNFPPVKYQVEKTAKKTVVTTEKAAFTFFNENFDKSYVVFNSGDKVGVKNKGNLGGTIRTLDTNWDTLIVNGVNALDINRKRLKLLDGVVSKSGVAVYDDSDSFIIDGEKIIKRPKQIDKYVFAFGHDYRAAVKAFFDISGHAPLIPRFALGNWWSRYHDYTQQEYIDLMDEFAEREIPLSVATIDMDWHYVDVYEDFIKESGRTDEKLYGAQNGWTGYSWNKKLFPNYKALLKNLRDRNLKVTLNLHPADGVRWFEDVYEEFAKKSGVDPESKRVIPFDMNDENFRKNYFEILHRPYEKDGVDFWWIDWQQGVKSSVEGLDPLWLLNHYHYKDSLKNGVALQLSRYCGAGAQRYPLGFSGDTMMNWRFLDIMPYFTATAANIGFGWWSHDIGGHHLGEKDNELTVRWLQFGVFAPINRLHSSHWKALSKEVWRYDTATGLIMTEQLKLRHKLVPYIHTYNHLSNENGRSICEPIYYEYPEQAEAYKAENEYFFGNELLVCPITKKGVRGISNVTAYLPEGFYTDLFTRKNYCSPKGGKTVKLYRDTGSIPVLVKDGGIIPLSEDKGNGCGNPEAMRILVFGEDAKFTMIEDNGEILPDHMTTLETTYSVKTEKGITTLTVVTDGDVSVAPAKRKVVFEFASIYDGEVLSCTEDGKQVAYNLKKNGCLKLFTEYCGGNMQVVISQKVTAKSVYFDKLGYVKQTFLSILEKVEFDNIKKNDLIESLCVAKTLDEFEKLIDDSTLPPERKAQVKELFE